MGKGLDGQGTFGTLSTAVVMGQCQDCRLLNALETSVEHMYIESCFPLASTLPWQPVSTQNEVPATSRNTESITVSGLCFPHELLLLISPHRCAPCPATCVLSRLDFWVPYRFHAPVGF